MCTEMDCDKLNSFTSTGIIRKAAIGATSLNQELGLFEFGNVIVQKNYHQNPNVRILSGGAYFMGDLVGKGMLTAAIQGEHFLAPASNTILRTLRELGNKHIMGTLIIIPSDTGTTLNFGLATERAVNEYSLKLRQVIVNDDSCKKVQINNLKRTLGGIILLFKIAGAMAEDERLSYDIHKFCLNCCSNMISTEIDVPELPDNPNSPCVCLKDPSIKLRVMTPLHIPLENMINLRDETASECFENFKKRQKDDNTDRLDLEPGDAVVILINNFALSPVEVYSCVGDVIERLEEVNIQVARCYVGNFLKIRDLSITLMKVIDDDVIKYLDAPCSASGWKSVNQGEFGPVTNHCVVRGLLSKTARVEPPIRGPILSDRGANILLFALQFACEALKSCENQLNIMDSDRDVRDIGTRMKYLGELLIRRLQEDKLNLKYPYTFLDGLGKLMDKALGSTTGCIYSILFEAAATAFSDYPEIKPVTSVMWLEAFERAAEALRRYGQAEFGEGTLYDPIFAFCKQSRLELEMNDSDEIAAFGKGVAKAEEVIQATKHGYNFPEPGAHTVGIWMRALYEGVKVRWPY